MPSKEHYRAATFFIPETNAYLISASAKKFPQHCDSLPDESLVKHLEYMADELTDAIT